MKSRVNTRVALNLLHMDFLDDNRSFEYESNLSFDPD